LVSAIITSYSEPTVANEKVFAPGVAPPPVDVPDGPAEVVVELAVDVAPSVVEDADPGAGAPLPLPLLQPEANAAMTITPTA
jgi:hypothetical protein